LSDQEKKNPLLALLIVINTAIVAIILFRQMGMSERVEKLTSSTAVNTSRENTLPYIPKAKPGSTIREYPFGKFTANLAKPSGPQRYITLEIVLYLETLSSKPLLEIENKKPGLRDEIISILNTRTPEEVLKLEGRGILKNLLKNHLNNQMKSDQVKELLFVNFLVN
jgi:flagellar FliL protein